MPLIIAAKAKGISAYISDGKNRWPAAHRRDAARLYQLTLEKGTAGSRYHAVGDEGIPFKDIAEAVGKRLNVPVKSITQEQAAEHFGFLAAFAGFDSPASAQWTRDQLGWTPAHAGLIEDIS